MLNSPRLRSAHPCCPWRSVQNAPNAFVMECFMDELAYAAGKDPVAFPLALFKNNMRARRVLQGRGRKGRLGEAISQKERAAESLSTPVLDPMSPRWRMSPSMKRMDTLKSIGSCAAVDCGPAVNPDTVEAQIEGGVVEALSTALKEEVEFANGGVKSANFDDYNIFRMSEIPEIEVHIVKSNEKIGGHWRVWCASDGSCCGKRSL